MEGFRETNAARAAARVALRLTHEEDPFYLRRLLDALGLERETGFEERALWQLCREEFPERFTEESWLRGHDETVAYLLREVPKRANVIRKRQRLEDEARGFYRIPFRKLFPEDYRRSYLGDPRLPASKRKPGVKGPPAHNPEDVSGGERQIFDGEEDRASFLKAAERFLPRRRHEVLQLSLQGLGDKEIASKLGIAHSTVRAHKRAAQRNPALKALVRRWFGVG